MNGLFARDGDEVAFVLEIDRAGGVHRGVVGDHEGKLANNATVSLAHHFIFTVFKFVHNPTNLSLTLLVSFDKASQSHIRQAEIFQVGQAVLYARVGLVALFLSDIYELHDGLVIFSGLLCHRCRDWISCRNPWLALFLSMLHSLDHVKELSHIVSTHSVLGVVFFLFILLLQHISVVLVLF